MRNPKVSIIMGIYNCENTLAESIESILNQTYDNWELVICDDCSTDNTFIIAEKYMGKYGDKIKLLKNHKNLTLGPTLNRCLTLATGEYIARHDGDDLYVKDKLEKQINFLEKNKKFDLAGTAMKCFDDEGYHGIRKLKEYPQGSDLMKGTTFAHATIMAKAEVMKELKGYSESVKVKGVEDYELWFRFFEAGYKGYNLQEALYDVREDRNAYRRKNYRRRISEIVVMYNGRKKLGLPFQYNMFILKPIITILTPISILRKYHRRKLTISSNMTVENHNHI